MREPTGREAGPEAPEALAFPGPEASREKIAGDTPAGERSAGQRLRNFGAFFTNRNSSHLHQTQICTLTRSLQNLDPSE